MDLAELGQWAPEVVANACGDGQQMQESLNPAPPDHSHPLPSLQPASSERTLLSFHSLSAAIIEVYVLSGDLQQPGDHSHYCDQLALS